MEEKRKDKRLDLEGELVIKRLDNNETSSSRAKINIKDVSKSGIGFTCQEPLSIGAVYDCYLTIWTKETIHCFIEIVRSFKSGADINYGGVFIGMPEMDSKRIEIYTTFQELVIH